VLERDGLPACGGAVGLLGDTGSVWAANDSMTRRRVLVIEHLMYWSYHSEAGQPADMDGRNPIDDWEGLVQVSRSNQSTHR
jgi:hypothetical protein